MLEQFLVELENLADRADAAGLHIMATSLFLNIRCARQFNRGVWLRLLTIVCTAIELCAKEK